MNVKHYLNIYLTRKKMQDDGITNPSKEIKSLTNEIVTKLSLMPLDEKVDIINRTMIDSKGNVIVTFPKTESEK